MKKILGTMFPLKHCLSYALKVPKKKIFVSTADNSSQGESTPWTKQLILLLLHFHLECLQNIVQLQLKTPAVLLKCLCWVLAANSTAGKEPLSACFDCQRLRRKYIMLNIFYFEIRIRQVG